MTLHFPVYTSKYHNPTLPEIDGKQHSNTGIPDNTIIYKCSSQIALYCTIPTHMQNVATLTMAGGQQLTVHTPASNIDK